MILTLYFSPAIAGKGGNKGGGGPDGYDRACAYLRDDISDKITSDGNGLYCDSGDGALQVIADSAGGGFRLQTSLAPGQRFLNLDLTDCLTADCTTPFSQSGDQGSTNNFLLGGAVTGGLPEAGATATVDSLFLMLYEGNDFKWWLLFTEFAGESDVTISGVDSDGDGSADVYVLEVSPDTPVLIEEFIYVTKGKKTELVGTEQRGVASVPFQLTFVQTGENY